MNDATRKAEWLRYLNVCRLRLNGLQAVRENDGEKMLAEVLKDLKLGTALELFDWLADDANKP